MSWVLRARSQSSLMAVGLPMAPDASPGHPSVQPGPPSQHLLGTQAREALGHPPPGKRCPVHHCLGLIVSSLEDTPRGAALRRPIMVAYALHDLWHPRQRLFLASEQRLDQLLLCFSFPSPLRCRNWPPSGSPWPGRAGGFQNEWGAAGRSGPFDDCAARFQFHRDVLARG